MRKRRTWLAVILAMCLLFSNPISAFAAAKSSQPSAPILSITPTAPTKGNVTVTVNYPSNAVTKQYKLGSNGSWLNYTGPFTITSNIYVYAQYKNSSGKWSSVGEYNITNIDKLSPVNPTFSASTIVSTNQNVTITISYSSDSTAKQYKIGSSGVYQNYTAPIVLSENSTVYAKASDSVGNWTPEVSYNVTNIDKVAPDVPTLSADMSSAVNGNVNVTISYPGDASIKQYKIGLSGTWVNYTVPVTVPYNNTVYAKCQDAAGNWSGEGSLDISNIDITAPDNPTFSASQTTSTTQPVTVSISYTDDSAIKQYKIGDSGIWTSYTTPLLLSSNNTVYAKASDNAGNWTPEVSYVVTNIVAKKQVLGYTVNSSAYNAMVANVGTLSKIATATWGIDGLGNLSGAAPVDQISFANSNGMKPSLVVSNNFDAAIAKTLLESAANRANLQNNILNTLKTYNYAGVDIDIENIPAADRAYFTTFMSEIYNKLKPLGYEISVAVPAKTTDSSTATWNYAFDYKSLANYSDYLMIMAYDEHYPGGTPGSIASIGWVTNVVNYALTVVPKDKLVLGLAAYGYDWPANGGTTKAYSINGCYNLASSYGASVMWDDTTKSKYFKYTDSTGISHTVWFEDADSIAYKLDLVNSKDLMGIGIWRLGLENTNYWDMIKSKFNK